MMASAATLRFEPGRIVAWTCLFLGGVVMILPFVYMLATSLKDNSEVYELSLLPHHPTLQRLERSAHLAFLARQPATDPPRQQTRARERDQHDDEVAPPQRPEPRFDGIGACAFQTSVAGSYSQALLIGTQDGGPDDGKANPPKP